MIVEFVGCAGAGKTTLLRSIRERGIPGREVVAMPDLVIDRPLLRRITHPTAINVAQELAGAPFLLASLHRDGAFVRYASSMLGAHARSRFDRVNGVRGIARKVGMYHLARRSAGNRVVLSDEGTLLSAYNLFVMTDVRFGPVELEHFARLAPMPDIVVYVRAPLESLVSRAVTRPDRRRQHIGRDTAAIREDVRRTVELFDRLTATAALEGRVITVDNVDGDAADRQRLLDGVSRRIDGWGAGGGHAEGVFSGTPGAAATTDRKAC